MKSVTELLSKNILISLAGSRPLYTYIVTLNMCLAFQKDAFFLSSTACLCDNTAFMFSDPGRIRDHRETEGDGFPWQYGFFFLLPSSASPINL